MTIFRHFKYDNLCTASFCSCFFRFVSRWFLTTDIHHSKKKNEKCPQVGTLHICAKWQSASMAQLYRAQLNYQKSKLKAFENEMTA